MLAEFCLVLLILYVHASNLCWCNAAGCGFLLLFFWFAVCAGLGSLFNVQICDWLSSSGWANILLFGCLPCSVWFFSAFNLYSSDTWYSCLNTMCVGLNWYCDLFMFLIYEVSWWRTLLTCVSTRVIFYSGFRNANVTVTTAHWYDYNVLQTFGFAVVCYTFTEDT